MKTTIVYARNEGSLGIVLACIVCRWHEDYPDGVAILELINKAEEHSKKHM